MSGSSDSSDCHDHDAKCIHCKKIMIDSHSNLCYSCKYPTLTTHTHSHSHTRDYQQSENNSMCYYYYDSGL